MTGQVTGRSSAQPVGPPPPFDPELAPVLEALTSLRPPDAYRPDNIVEMREPVPGVETPTDEILSRGGAYGVEERVVPGPDGQPDISLLICLPKRAATPTPVIYHVHGGGMIVGDNRFGLVEMLDLAEPMGMAVVSVEYRLAPETRHPVPSRTATRAWCGCRSTSTNSTSTPSASSSPVRAPAAASQQVSP